MDQPTITGPIRYSPSTRWPPAAAVGAGVAIFATAAGLATLVAGAVFGPAGEAVPPHGSPRGTYAMMVWLILMQAVIVALTTYAAGAMGDSRRDVLALRKPAQGYGVALKAFLLMAASLAAFALVLFKLAPDILMRDLAPFQRMMRTEAWWVVLIAVGIGAPLSEELLFRGFLFSAIAKSKAGRLGASLATTLVWTALHSGYSGLGILEVALIGLFFCWLLLRTGSLLVPLICHSLYNSMLVVALMVLPLPQA